MKLLFITQKLHAQDTFGILWINEFRRQGFDVTVLCLEDRVSPQEFPVYSMGKEKGYGKIRQVLRFWQLIGSLSYDRVFIHMSPVWGMLGAPVFIARRKPTYLWYTHYKLSFSMRVVGWYAKRLFCATPQSLPQYEGYSKKVVIGHGIDLTVWPKRENHTENSHELLMVHRLSRSKRVEIVLQALMHLPEYTLVIYGIEAEKDYVRELRKLIEKLSLSDRVTFKGTIPMTDLPSIYQSHRLILNMATETIDKTMLEAMTCGCYPVVTQRNAEAIGIPLAPNDDGKGVTDFIQQYHEQIPMRADEMYRVVETRHGLRGLIAKMGSFIMPGV